MRMPSISSRILYLPLEDVDVREDPAASPPPDAPSTSCSLAPDPLTSEASEAADCTEAEDADRRCCCDDMAVMVLYLGDQSKTNPSVVVAVCL